MKFISIIMFFGLVSCGETMTSGKSDQSNQLMTSIENSSPVEKQDHKALDREIEKAKGGDNDKGSKGGYGADEDRESRYEDEKSAREIVKAAEPYEEDRNSQQAALTDRITVYLACNLTSDETEIVCEVQEDDPSNRQYRFNFKIFDYDGNELTIRLSYKGDSAHIKGDFSELSYMKISTNNPYIDIENPTIDF